MKTECSVATAHVGSKGDKHVLYGFSRLTLPRRFTVAERRFISHAHELHLADDVLVRCINTELVALAHGGIVGAAVGAHPEDYVLVRGVSMLT